MKILTKEEEAAIMNTLDCIHEKLYYDVVLPDDTMWSHKTIKRLLYIINILQGEVDDNDDG